MVVVKIAAILPVLANELNQILVKIEISRNLLCKRFDL
ncbi:hypothetical protein PULV_a3668 [Pseudoalteromonas ulvae UL12]|nr:hypothetical protein [Pseudoalteromonas ulvae UL12]